MYFKKKLSIPYAPCHLINLLTNWAQPILKFGKMTGSKITMHSSMSPTIFKTFGWFRQILDLRDIWASKPVVWLQAW